MPIAAKRKGKVGASWREEVREGEAVNGRDKEKGKGRGDKEKEKGRGGKKKDKDDGKKAKGEGGNEINKTPNVFPER